MIVFDVDGTLLRGESTDWKCFGSAFEEAAGFSLTSDFFSNLKEVTARAIVYKALSGRKTKDKKVLERKVCSLFLEKLQKAHQTDQNCFPATNGAVNLLKKLRQTDIPIAIATGDWRESITFKLKAARIDIDGIPIMTSSEYSRRATIISSVINHVGYGGTDSIYVGDGLWDLRACKKLGISFVGVGEKKEKLKAAGAKYLLDDLTPEHFFDLSLIRKKVGDMAIR